jgi:hypothetical protein
VTVSHDALMNLLAAHLRSNTDRMVWCDMQLGPMHSPRPDVWTLNKSYTSPRPLAYEVKVTKADFQRDVSAGKWQSYLAYSCAVIFAVPLGLITKADLPKGCGLMTWNGECWHTAKAPTLNPTPTFSHDLMMKLLIDGVRREAAVYRTESRSAWKAADAFAKKFGSAAARAISEEIDFDQRLEQVQKRFSDAQQKAKDTYDADRKRTEETVSAAQIELCKAIGIPETSHGWEIRSRVMKLARAVNQDEEVNELRRQLAAIRQALLSAEKTPNAEALQMDMDLV